MTRRILMFLLLLSLLISGVAYGEDPHATDLQSFVSKLYHDYASESFAAVYAVMHPSIREAIAEEEYVTFQSHHFARLSLQIADIEVAGISENPRLPRTLRQLLPDHENLQVYGVEISYNAHFVRGVRLNQSISKTVYVALLYSGTARESLYLLWDPSSMEEEEPDK